MQRDIPFRSPHSREPRVFACAVQECAPNRSLSVGLNPQRWRIYVLFPGRRNSLEHTLAHSLGTKASVHSQTSQLCPLVSRPPRSVSGLQGETFPSHVEEMPPVLPEGTSENIMCVSCMYNAHAMECRAVSLRAQKDRIFFQVGKYPISTKHVRILGQVCTPGIPTSFLFLGSQKSRRSVV